MDSRALGKSKIIWRIENVTRQNINNRENASIESKSFEIKINKLLATEWQV
jgi:hypothetical protein